jgi:hypothetical protein
MFERYDHWDDDFPDYGAGRRLVFTGIKLCTVFSQSIAQRNKAMHRILTVYSLRDLKNLKALLPGIAIWRPYSVACYTGYVHLSSTSSCLEGYLHLSSTSSCLKGYLHLSSTSCCTCYLEYGRSVPFFLRTRYASFPRTCSHSSSVRSTC